MNRGMAMMINETMAMAADRPKRRLVKLGAETINGLTLAGLGGGGPEEDVRQREVVDVVEGGQQEGQRQGALEVGQHDVAQLRPPWRPVQRRRLVHLTVNGLQPRQGEQVDERPGRPDLDE